MLANAAMHAPSSAGAPACKKARFDLSSTDLWLLGLDVGALAVLVALTWIVGRGPLRVPLRPRLPWRRTMPPDELGRSGDRPRRRDEGHNSLPQFLLLKAEESDSSH